MKFSELAQHIHELRYEASGRAIGRGMRYGEVLGAALNCPKNGVDKVFYYETKLPEPMHGVFSRLDHESGETWAAIYVQRHLDEHWREFVAIKELMHCWSPGTTRVATEQASRQLVEALTTKQGRYTPNVAADSAAVFAAAEVILPHYTVERHLAENLDTAEIAHRHGLHVDIVEMICRHEVLQARKRGSMNGD
ncbi:hypothetical protein [Roseovarius sp.]|uniref:hypothetical protein n=1 Tax=Roseovarius sp. TaxID=1486281 RepID=UPI00351997B1